MKKKNKLLALLEIAVVLCSVFLVATLPGIAADQKQTTQEVTASEVTTASEDDFILEIYGNANEDDCIDMRDYTYTARIICWLEEETTFADANYDGRISVADMTQIGLIILGRESELTIIDTAERAVTVSKPVGRIVIIIPEAGEVLKALGAIDKVVGKDEFSEGSPYVPELSDIPTVGIAWGGIDYELVVSLDPDLVLIYPSTVFEVAEILDPLGIPVVGLEFMNTKFLKAEVEKLGYLIDKEDEAKEYNDWRKYYEDKIESLVDELSEEEKPKVFMIIYYWPIWGTEISTVGSDYAPHEICTEAGGIDIVGELGLPGDIVTVEAEWVLEQNPDVIIGIESMGSDESWDSIGYYDTEEPEELISDITSFPGWESIKAVQDDRTYMCSADMVLGLESVSILAFWAEAFHPEFDLHPEDIYREFVEQFMDVPYPEDLILFYPPIGS